MKLEFWAKWFNKWVLTHIPNRLIVQYESILENPLPSFEAIVRFMGDDSPRMDRLNDCITQANIRKVPNSTAKWIGWI
jgi:hypothetical protein